MCVCVLETYKCCTFKTCVFLNFFLPSPLVKVKDMARVCVITGKKTITEKFLGLLGINGPTVLRLEQGPYTKAEWITVFQNGFQFE